MGQKVALDFYKVISKTRITTVYAIRRSELGEEPPLLATAYNQYTPVLCARWGVRDTCARTQGPTADVNMIVMGPSPTFYGLPVP